MMENQGSSDSDSDTISEELDHVTSETVTLKSGSVSERVSPLEEFNTLHRNVDNIRASIKVRESKVV